MSKVKILSLFILVVAMFSCIQKLDFNEMDKNVSYGTSLVMPVGYSTMTAAELVAEINNPIIVADANSNTVFLHIMQNEKLSIDEFLKLNMVQSSSNAYSLNSMLGSLSLPANIDHTNVDAANAQLGLLNNGLFDFGLDRYENSQLVRRVDYVKIGSTKLVVNSVVTDITGLSANGAKIKIDLKFPNIEGISARTFTFYADGVSNSSEWVLSDIEMSFLQGHLPRSRTSVDVSYSFICPDGSTIALGADANVQTWIEFDNIRVELAKGWFGESYLVASDNIEKELPTDFFKSEVVANNQLLFHNPIITLNVRHNAGAPLSLIVNGISCSNEQGQSVSADFNGSPSVVKSLARATTVGAESNTTIVCDREHGATNRLFTVQKPSKIKYNFSLNFDKDVAPQDLIDEIQHFVLRPTYMDLDIDVKLPFHFDPKTNFSRVDTIKDVNLDSIMDALKIDFEHVELYMTFNNHLPIYGEADIFFVDAVGNVLYEFKDLVIQGPSVDTNGMVQSAMKSDVNLSVEKDYTSAIRAAKHVIIKYSLKGKTENDQINIRATDWLKATLGLYVKGMVKTHLDSLFNNKK